MVALTEDTSICFSIAPAGSTSGAGADVGCLTPIAVTIAQACQMSGLSRATLYRAISARRLPTRKLGARTLIIVEELRSFLTALPSGDAQ